MSKRHTYRVFARGSGLVRVIDGVPCAVGFYTSTFVAGADKTAAREMALELLRARLTEKGAITERTTVAIESIEEIRPEQVPDVQPGFAFYRE